MMQKFTVRIRLKNNYVVQRLLNSFPTNSYILFCGCAHVGYITSTKIKMFAAIKDVYDGNELIREAGLKALFVSHANTCT